MTSRSLLRKRVSYLMIAAGYAVHRCDLRASDLMRDLGFSRGRSQDLIRQLSSWHIVKRNGRATASRVIIQPQHERRVLNLIAEHQGRPPDPNPLDQLAVPGLTAQQRRVLDLVAQGMDNNEISDLLMVTRATVKTHVRHLCDDFNARNRTHLVHVAHQHALLPNPYEAVSKEDSQ